jgi:hypothetical protein
LDAGFDADIEIEADSGILAYRHLHETISRHIPETAPAYTLRRRHEPTPNNTIGTVEATA